MLGNALCETLNRIRQNNNRVPVEKDNLYWLTQSDCVWAEIVGVNKAQEYLLDKFGEMTNTPNVYDQNNDLIHSHFHPDTLPLELNKILGGPSKMLEPMFHKDCMEEEQHVNKGSHLPIMLDTDEGEQL